VTALRAWFPVSDFDEEGEDKDAEEETGAFELAFLSGLRFPVSGFDKMKMQRKRKRKWRVTLPTPAE
jgi:hypothetical protein